MTDEAKKAQIAAKLKKIKALAERGVGGEKETALRMYEDLKTRYELEDEEIMLDTVTLHWFSYADQMEEDLLTQIFYMVTGSASYHRFTGNYSRRKKRGCDCTEVEATEITLYFNFYKAELKREEDSGFFEAPASTKYHGNYPGGLAEHSNYVYKRLIALASNEDKRLDRLHAEYTLDTLATVALLHDVCKIDAYKLEKKNQKQKDGTWKTVDQYGYTNAFPVGHGEKSVIQIMRFMELSDEEILAINWHMGGFDCRVKGGSYDMNNAFNGSRLAAMLHIADMMATHLDERGGRANE